MSTLCLCPTDWQPLASLAMSSGPLSPSPELLPSPHLPGLPLGTLLSPLSGLIAGACSEPDSSVLLPQVSREQVLLALLLLALLLALLSGGLHLLLK